jgi:UDP-GlcNAc3NAcA epimerase
LKIVTIVGARPQFIKAAAISREIKKRQNIDEVIVHTGQHFDSNMSDVFFRELDIPKPRYNLDIHGSSHGVMTGKMLGAIEQVIIDERPDMLLIYGDTNSTLAGGLAASKINVPIAHVEAGLRSFNRQMPEEINRIVSDHLSELLLCPTHLSVKNLELEGISKGVHHVGDVMYDATIFAREKAIKHSTILESLNVLPNNYSLCTLHRAQSTDDIDLLYSLIDYLEKAAKNETIIFPVHPRTKAAFERNNIKPKGLLLIDPVGYLDINRLLASANRVFTDSGGLQKEAYFHRVPCVTLRDETEWVELIENGWNRLWREDEYQSPRKEIPEYGIGTAAKKTIDVIVKHIEG